jgi:hypothetical protein
MPLMRWRGFATRLIHFKANPAFEDMNKRQLNRALEELNHATNRCFLRLEKLAVTPPLEPVAMRWSVIRSDKTLHLPQPHPTSTKAAIVASRRCLIWQELLNRLLQFLRYPQFVYYQLCFSQQFLDNLHELTFPWCWRFLSILLS